MPLRLLVDEDSQSRLLVRSLRAAGHDVLTANEAGLGGLADAQVLERAVAEERVVLSRNAADFLVLHRTGEKHFGILVVHQHSDWAKNLSYVAIVSAIANLESTGVELEGAFLALNAYVW